jgi:uncharacterized membrane protein
MGHYCRICGRERPNEQFSGKGHRIHVCKRCKAMPKSERQVIENIRILFRCWQDRVAYDENAYLAALARHGSPLGVFVTTEKTL